MENRHILFVDDNQAILDALRRALDTHRRALDPMDYQWHLAFTNDGQTALKMMAEETCDIIVSDMLMPGMNGAELLRKVKESHPHVVRIVLSGQSDIDLLPPTLQVAHQFLSKPVESKRLTSTIYRACALKDMLKNDALSEVILQIEILPSHPTLLTELRGELHTPKPSAHRVGDIISRDMGLTLKMLQVVNSGFFASHRLALDPRQVGHILGIDTIRDIADLAVVLPEHDRALSALPPLRDLWKHSLNAGQIAEAIARAESLNQEIASKAYLAAFMHDIGKIILATHLPDKYATMLSIMETREMLQPSAEKHVFGSGHPDVGAFLLALWGMPSSIFIPVACHHELHRCQDSQQTVLAAIAHTANIFEHAATIGDWQDVEDHLDVESLDMSGLKQRLPVWREVSQSLINSEVTNGFG